MAAASQAGSASQAMAASQTVFGQPLSEAARRAIRQHQRLLAEDIQARRDTLVRPGDDMALELLKRENDVFSNVNAAHEAATDSKILRSIAGIGVEKAKNLRPTFEEFSFDEFAIKLVHYMKGHPNEPPRPEALDWAALGGLSVKLSRRAPQVDFMLGPLEIRHKERTRVVREKPLRDHVQMQKPMELSKEEIKQSENETTKHVKSVYDCLVRQNGPINYFRFVVNPTSFSQTVENIFFVAFLVRDKKVRLFIGNDGQPWLEAAVNVPAEAAEGMPGRQLIIEITMQQYQEIIQLYGIRQSVIPTRRRRT